MSKAAKTLPRGTELERITTETQIALALNIDGTGIYKVETVTPEQIVMSSSFLYDGNPASSGETTVKNGGRTTCWKGDCSISTDASGVSINPLLWGAPTGKLHVGQTWEVAIGVPWELGPAGKQTVRVVSIDPSNDSITLEREGEGEGDALNEIKTLPLIKDKKTYTVQVKAARAKWSGYATFRRGVILSDVLFVERPVISLRGSQIRVERFRITRAADLDRRCKVPE